MTSANQTYDWMLSFSAGLREGEALQAEKAGKRSLLCVEEQDFCNAEGVSGALLQTDRWPLRTSD